MSQFFHLRFFFILKTLSCMCLFLCCLALFLYGVIWVATLLFCLPKYLWLNIEIIRYKSFIVLLIPTLLWGIWWFIYVFKNQNEIIITKLKASLLDETKHKEIYQKISLLSMAVNIKMPKLYQVTDTGINSLLISNSKQESILIFSSQLIQKNKLNDIINMSAFHLSYISNQRNAFNTFIIALTSCFSHWFEIIMLRFFKTRELPFHLERFRPLFYPIRFVLLPLVAVLSIFALYDRLIAPILAFFFVKNSTFDEDKKAILLLKTPQKYINTLYLVQDNPRVSAFENGATSISCFQDPKDHLSFFKLIDTHPTINTRIQKIKKEFKAYFIYEKEEE